MMLLITIDIGTTKVCAIAGRKNEYDKIIAVHGWAGSHQNNTQGKMNELRNIIDIN